jgi:excisionase family DNA binding protein
MSQLSYRKQTSPPHERVEKRLLPIPEVSETLSLGQTVVWKLIRENRLRSVKVGGRRLVPLSEVDALVEQLVEEQTEGAPT